MVMPIPAKHTSWSSHVHMPHVTCTAHPAHTACTARVASTARSINATQYTKHVPRAQHAAQTARDMWPAACGTRHAACSTRGKHGMHGTHGMHDTHDMHMAGGMQLATRRLRPAACGRHAARSLPRTARATRLSWHSATASSCHSMQQSASGTPGTRATRHAPRATHHAPHTTRHALFLCGLRHASGDTHGT